MIDNKRYTQTAAILHWLVAVLIIVNVGLIWTVDYLPEAWGRPVIDTHKSIGITVLGLGLLRILWRAAHAPPPLPDTYAGWEQFGAKAAHIVLYGLIFCMPLSGWMHDSAWKDAATHPMRLFGTLPWPRIGTIAALPADTKETMHIVFGKIHTALAYVLYGLLALHIGGALKHQLFDKERELQRILPWGRKP